MAIVIGKNSPRNQPLARAKRRAYCVASINTEGAAMSKLMFLVAIALSLTARAAVQLKEIEYKAGDQTMLGYLAWDDSSQDKRPGILVIHEWWGNNDYSKMRAQKLAELGYVALAADTFGKGK